MTIQINQLSICRKIGVATPKQMEVIKASNHRLERRLALKVGKALRQGKPTYRGKHMKYVERDTTLKYNPFRDVLKGEKGFVIYELFVILFLFFAGAKVCSMLLG